jgi:hypothetical protein
MAMLKCYEMEGIKQEAAVGGGGELCLMVDENWGSMATTPLTIVTDVHALWD